MRRLAVLALLSAFALSHVVAQEEEDARSIATFSFSRTDTYTLAPIVAYVSSRSTVLFGIVDPQDGPLEVRWVALLPGVRPGRWKSNDSTQELDGRLTAKTSLGWDDELRVELECTLEGSRTTDEKLTLDGKPVELGEGRLFVLAGAGKFLQAELPALPDKLPEVRTVADLRTVGEALLAHLRSRLP